MAKKRTQTRPQLIPDLLIGIGILLIPVGICTGVIADFIAYNQPPPEFCTKEDEVYPLISENSDDWMSYFHDQVTFSVVNFSTSNGTVYVAIPIRNVFYVQIRRQRDEPYGLVGYAYISTNFLDHRYKVRQLDEQIYCYEL